jgi:hypothetical protein
MTGVQNKSKLLDDTEDVTDLPITEQTKTKQRNTYIHKRSTSKQIDQLKG